MPLFGRLADVYGYPRLYIVGLGIFAVGSLLVALSRSVEELIGARVIQAIGGSAAVPIGFALAVSAVPRERQGLALGIVGAAAEAGSMLGPAYGGAIVELANWRWLFWLNLPQVLLVAPLLLLLRNRRQTGVRVDYLGGRDVAATVPGPVPEKPVYPGLRLALWSAGGGTGTGAGLLGAQGPATPAAAPAVSHPEFRHCQPGPDFGGGVTGNRPGDGAADGQHGDGQRPLYRRAVAAADDLCHSRGRGSRGGLLSRLGNRPVIATGLLLIAFGLFLVSGWPLDVTDPQLTLHLVVAGLGFGLVIAPIMALALNAAPPGYHATASSMVVVARLLAMTLGLAALAAYGIEHFQTLTSGLLLPLPAAGESPAETAARVAAYATELQNAGLALFHRFFRIAAVVSLLALVPLIMKREWLSGINPPKPKPR